LEIVYWRCQNTRFDKTKHQDILNWVETVGTNTLSKLLKNTLIWTVLDDHWLMGGSNGLRTLV